MNTRLLIIGLGNPILGDDSVGWRIVERLTAVIIDPWIETDCLAVGGLALMERLVGYREAILVDAIHTGGAAPGSLHHLTPAILPPAAESYTRSIHDSGLQEALHIGHTLHVDLPQRIEIVAIEIMPALEFSEALTPAIAAAIPRAEVMIQRMILDLFGRNPILTAEVHRRLL